MMGWLEAEWQPRHWAMKRGRMFFSKNAGPSSADWPTSGRERRLSVSANEHQRNMPLMLSPAQGAVGLQADWNSMRTPRRETPVMRVALAGRARRKRE